MHESIFFNSGLLSASGALIPAVSSACLFGKGIFTTLAIHDQKPFLWEKHWKRLQNNSAKIGIDLGDFNEDQTQKALGEIVAANSVRNGRARITFLDESASELWSYTSQRRTNLVITTGDFRPEAKKHLLAISPYRINSASPTAGVKSCNYLEKTLALDEAKQRGFDEAIQLNERGEIVSACMANVFWLTRGKLFTPSLKTGCLAGTTRDFVLENLECEEVEVGLEEVQSAGEIFLTSAGLGIVNAARFAERDLTRSSHAVYELLPMRH